MSGKISKYIILILGGFVIILVISLSSCEEPEEVEEDCPGCGSVPISDIRIKEIISSVNGAQMAKYEFMYASERLVSIKGFVNTGYKNPLATWEQDYNLEVSYEQNEIVMTGSLFLKNEWVYDFRRSVSFNGNLPSYEVQYQYEFDQWMEYKKTDYTWASGKPGEIVDSHWENRSWNYDLKKVYSYDSDQHLTTGEYYNYNSDAWELDKQLTFYYSGSLLSEFIMEWNFGVDQLKYTFRYNGDKLVESQMLERTQTGGWEIAQSLSYSYNNTGLINHYSHEIGSNTYSFNYLYEKGKNNLPSIAKSYYGIGSEYNLPYQVAFNEGLKH